MRESADANAANCTGDGINFEQADQPQRFTYLSQLRLDADGSFSEKWVVTFDTGSRRGKSQFSRVSGATR
jgi:hypothetical protein